MTDEELEVELRLWRLAFNRPEWFRNARATRMMLERRRVAK